MLIVVVANVDVPDTVKRLVTVDVPAVRSVKKPTIEDNKLEKKEVEVAAEPEALVKDSELMLAANILAKDTLVVAKVVVPNMTKLVPVALTQVRDPPDTSISLYIAPLLDICHD